MQKSPDFSPFARQYSESRPDYPPELYSFLASLPASRDCAWDAATGSGQAAADLALYFRRVIASDISTEQIRFAVRKRNLLYQVCRSEQPGISDKSVDMVTVASALHWFNRVEFYEAVRRLIRPGGILAAWSYHVGYMEPPFRELFVRFYSEVLFDYFAPGARIVDRKYTDIVLPGEPVPAPDFFMKAEWKIQQMLDFIGSWSGTRHYMEKKGSDPVEEIRDELENIWGDAETIQSIRWPLFLKISKF